MNGVLVSTVANASATATKGANTATLLNDIKAGKWRDSVEQIRAKYSRAVAEGCDPKKAVANLKKKLPGVLWSGRFQNRKKPAAEKLLTHSGLLCADLDDLGERLSEVRGRLLVSPHLFALFLSPTATGLKAVFRVPAGAPLHARSFAAVAAHVRELCGVDVDAACKDVSRLCFVSHDPDLWLNPDEPIEITESGETPTPIRLNTASCITTCLHLCISASLHNKADLVLANITARKEAQQTLAAKHPNLVRLYTEFIEQRFQAEAHARNDFIVRAVPFLYRAVAPQFVLELVGCFYDCNRALFNDTREQHMKEAEAMLESVTKTYTESLNADERRIYNALPKNEQEALRICRDLALLEKPDIERGMFYMSFNQLGDRLGIFPMQAQRIMRQLESYGLIKLLKKGTRRAVGVRGEAGTYQWLILP